MPIFPLELPPATSERGKTTVNLARLIGPLFGVVSDHSPRDMTWVCDYEAITLKELGRGAPLPLIKGKDKQQLELGARVGRAIAGNKGHLEGEVTAATINNYGPDTKAAIVLTAANKLYDPIVADIVRCLEVFDEANSGIRPAVMLAAWANATLLGFRSAPLLCVSAIKARTSQRVAFAQWDVSALNSDVEPARCELGHSNVLNKTDYADVEFAPRNFNLIDETVKKLQGILEVQSPQDLEYLASSWGRVLLRLGTTSDDGDPALFWVSEVVKKHRTVEVYKSPIAVVEALVREQQLLPRITKIEESQRDGIPADLVIHIPTDERMRELSQRQQRIFIDTVRNVLRWLRDSLDVPETVKDRTRQSLDELRLLAEELLPADDYLRMRAVATDAQAKVDEDSAEHVSTLIEVLDLIQKEIISRRIADIGDGMNALETGAVVLRRYLLKAQSQGAERGISDEELEQKVRQYRETLYRILSDEIGLPRGASSAGFYLHNYTAHLSRSDDEFELRMAFDLMTDRVIPSRRLFVTGFRAKELRLPLQSAARCGARLAAIELDSGHQQSAHQLIQQSMDLAREAVSLGDHDGLLTLESGDVVKMTSVRLAHALIPTFTLAVETRSVDFTDHDMNYVEKLFGVLDKWVSQDKSNASRKYISETQPYRNRYVKALAQRQ